MSVDVSVWRADIERQMAEWPTCEQSNPDQCTVGSTGVCCSGTGRIPSPVYIVGEGVPGPTKPPCKRHEQAGMTTECFCPTFAPPVGWPSPNETERCYPCNGNGRPASIVGWNDLTAISGGTGTCSACGGSGVTAGTRTELTVTCSDPDGHAHSHRDRQGKVTFCTGSVLWATATWQTLPVVAKDIHGTPPDDYLYVLDDGRVFRCTGENEEQITALAAGSVRPGMYVAVLTGIELA